jgi:class 3 adenylate cyclase/tetratricopeptide (TPR) repeat protein
MQDVRRWLNRLGLDRYSSVFEENDVDLETLRLLADVDLEKLGVSLGHRKKLLKAIAELDGIEPSAPSTVAQENEPSSQESASTKAERRQLTVLFCDLVGSTALAECLDPEELRELMQAYQRACGEVIARYEGHVAQYLGDGLMVYFGWPRAHEDDAIRAIRAGMETAQAVSNLKAYAPIRARVGIDTGLVVVGETGQGDASIPKAAVGETPNIAARLQALAEPGSVVVSDRTRALAGGLFDYADLGAHTLKGISEPLRLFRVVGARAIESRFDAARSEAVLTPLVGREEEIALLLRRWQDAREGEGQVVLLGGDPGVGKSRLTRALRERLKEERYMSLRYQCSPHHLNSALYPVIEQLERAAGFTREDSTEQKLNKMQAVLVGSDEQMAADAQLFAALLSLAVRGYPPLNLSPQKQKDKTLEALAHQVEALAQRQPVLMIYEDAHWIDPTSQEALDLLVPRLQRLPVLLILTYRPEYSPRWGEQAHVTALGLNRLGRRQGAELVSKLSGGKALPQEVLDQILVHTDGVPLFVEELTKSVLESKLLRDAGNRYVLDGPMPELAIPTTLRDSLIARLDRLAPIREVAQIGACIGREFSYELLSALSPLKGGKLDEALEQLTTTGLLSRRGAPPDAVYTFKHALVQDAAYDSLLKSTRRQLHTRIAHTLETQFSTFAETSPESPAMHFERAGLPDAAVSWYIRAGSRAQARSANREAVSHFERALSLLDQISAQEQHEGLELELRTNLGVLFTALEGWTSSRAYAHCRRAHELSNVAGCEDKWMVASSSLTYQMAWTGRVTEARKLGEALVRAAGLRSDRHQEMLARDAYGTALMYSGRPREAVAQLDVVLQRYDRETDAGSAFRYGHDFGASALGMSAYLQWEAGYPDRALELADAAIDLARSVAHNFTLATALTYPGTDLSHFMRNPERTLRFAREGEEVAEKAGFAYHAHTCSFHHGFCQVGLGRVDEGVSRMLAALEHMKQLGALTRRTPRLTAQLAEALGDRGRADEGLKILEASPDRAPGNTRVRFAEIYRIEGDLHLGKRQPDAASAETCYREAIAIAIEDGVRMRQLRASTRLARLWLTQGKADDANNLLRPLYDSFTEGFATPDLMDAKGVLDEVGASCRSAA